MPCLPSMDNTLWATGTIVVLLLVICYAIHSQRSKRGSTKLSTASAVRIGLTYLQVVALTLPVRAVSPKAAAQSRHAQLTTKPLASRPPLFASSKSSGPPRLRTCYKSLRPSLIRLVWSLVSTALQRARGYRT